MSIEKTWERIGPVPFTANGGADGLVTIGEVVCFKVKQRIVVSSDTQPDLVLQVKRVLSFTQLIVGPIRSKTKTGKTENNLKLREDISAYLLADNAAIRAEEQPKTLIPPNDIAQATFEHEPANAVRTMGVDCVGNPWGELNPLPVTASVSVGDIQVQLERKDNTPNANDRHDATRVGNQEYEWNFRPDCEEGKGEGRVADTLHCGGIQGVIQVGTTPVLLKKGGANRVGRKNITAIPKAKGLFFGFESNVTADNGVDGGTPLNKNQYLIVAAEDNTDVYLVAASGTINVAITEA